MNKYIDAEKMEKKIEMEIESSSKGIKPGKSDEKSTFCRGEVSALYTVKSIIASLQQEQPSLPSNLDEAAEEYARNYIPFDQCDSRDIIRTFKAGAEWMAGQGETVEGYIAGINEVAAILAIPRKEHNKGDKVVVQIRKK